MVFLRFVTLAACLCFLGCDTGNPEIDHNVGAAEVGVGTTMEVGGSAVATGAPHPVAKGAGVGVAAGGAVIRADGEARMQRASDRMSRKKDAEGVE